VRRCFLHVSLCGLVIGSLVVTGMAQNRAVAKPNARGPGWTARFDSVQRTREQTMTPAEQAILDARFSEYERLFAAPDSLGRPQGFLVRPSVGGSVRGYPFDVPRFGYSLVLAPDMRDARQPYGCRKIPAPGTSGWWTRARPRSRTLGARSMRNGPGMLPGPACQRRRWSSMV
jgi:hypothetical protein